MCQSGTCQDFCRKNGRRRPASCCKHDFTPLTITIPQTDGKAPVETLESVANDVSPIPPVTMMEPSIAA